jgi:hypothetical protein
LRRIRREEKRGSPRTEEARNKRLHDEEDNTLKRTSQSYRGPTIQMLKMKEPRKTYNICLYKRLEHLPQTEKKYYSLAL